PPAGSVGAGGRPSPGARRRQCRRHRCRDQRGAGAALGADGTASDLSPRRRQRRDRAFSRAARAAARKWWNDLGSPRLTPEVSAALADGVAAEAGGRDIATLEAARDRFLVDLLALKQAQQS